MKWKWKHRRLRAKETKDRGYPALAAKYEQAEAAVVVEVVVEAATVVVVVVKVCLNEEVREEEEAFWS